MTQAQPSFSRSESTRAGKNASRSAAPRTSSTYPDNSTSLDNASNSGDENAAAEKVRLVQEAGIPVYPTLARVLGINAAAVIQQIYYYMIQKANTPDSQGYYEGRWWVYNSYRQWCETHFTWMTPRTLQSIIMTLEDEGILLSRQGVANRWDRRKWYSLDLEVLDAKLLHHPKNVSSNVQKLHDEYTKSTSKKKALHTSRSEKTHPDQSVHSPNGDSCADDDLLNRGMPEGEMRADQPAETVSVKAHDSLELENLQNREESLPVSSTAEKPIPSRPVIERPKPASGPTQSASERPKPAPRPVQSASEKPRSAPPAAKPVLERPQSASSVKSGFSSQSSHSHSPMLVAVMHVLKVRGSYAGKVGQFFRSAIPRSKKDLWAHYQPDVPATPQEVVALLEWYKQHPAYSVSCTQHGTKLPSTPALLRDRLDEFRDSLEYDQMLDAALPLLERLMRGESVSSSVPVASMRAVESAAAYKAYESTQDLSTHHPADSDTLDTFNQIFGDQS